MTRIKARLRQFSDAAADNFADSIEGRMRQIAEHPRSGRTVPEYGVPLLRELIEGPYRIVYELFPDRVEVVIVRHGREHFDR